jgi:2-keto-3-deoxy-L-rhamnonate aldolase RhmA
MAWLAVLMPLILQGVQFAEKFFGKSTGDDKKEAATDLINAGVDVATKKGLIKTDDLAQVKQGIDGLIDGTVHILNTTGVFKK